MFNRAAFDNMRLKERMQSAQLELSTGWKTIAEKAKKEAKSVNKKARKVLATEDGGELREEYILKADMDAGHNLFQRFQNQWTIMHKNTMENIANSEKVDQTVSDFAREWKKWNTYLEEFQANLSALPELIAKVENTHKTINEIGEQTELIEGLLVQLEDANERRDLEIQKMELRVKLSELIATKHAEYSLKKSIYESNKDKPLVDTRPKEVVLDKETLDRQKSEEKQKAYGDAFLEQMERYIQSGEVEKPIKSTESTPLEIEEDIQIGEDDLSTLREFLGPEEVNSVIQAQASQNKTKSENSHTLITNDNITEETNESSASENDDDIVEKTERNLKVDGENDGNQTDAQDSEKSDNAPDAQDGEKSNNAPDVQDIVNDDELGDKEDDVLKKEEAGNSDEENEFYDAE